MALTAGIVEVIALLEFGGQTGLPRTDRAVLVAVKGLIIAAADGSSLSRTAHA